MKIHPDKNNEFYAIPSSGDRRRRQKWAKPRFMRRIYWKWLDLKRASKNATGLHSARYILDDVEMDDLERITGLPMGVIAAAYENIFYDEH